MRCCCRTGSLLRRCGGRAAQPLVQSLNPPSHHVHGAEGFGDVPVKQPYGTPVEMSAADYNVNACRQHSGEIILCAVGPLTNIAAALKVDPELVNHVQKVVIMGGTVWSPGNVSAYAEANIWNDPHAADEVFAADWDIDLIGLDVTQKISCDDADFAHLRKAAPDIGGFLHEISAFYIKYYHSIFQKHVCLMHDPLHWWRLRMNCYLGSRKRRCLLCVKARPLARPCQMSVRPGGLCGLQYLPMCRK